jgi:aminoglycoside phosphotransferase (APT) family kinase protein
MATDVGVIDWGTAGYGDPAEDFDALRHASEELAEAVLAAYPYADSDLRHRIERHWQLRELWGVLLALELGDEAELRDAVRKLRAGPVLASE